MVLNRVQQVGGRYEMTTVSDDTLVAVPSGGGLAMQSGTGGVRVITTAEVDQSNGVILVANGVLVPY